jgi:ABC-2 type transport system permease protein
MKMKMKQFFKIYLIPIILITSIFTSFFLNYRIDLTADKRFSISEQTKQLLAKTNEKVNATIYLHGDLNAGFTGLKKSTVALLEEMSVYSKGITISYQNPSEAESEQERQKNYDELQALGMKPFVVFERDKGGKSVRKIIFPWLKLRYADRVVYVNLLKNIRGLSGEENLNISNENLEFEIADGLRRLLNTKVERIAFIEGHGEADEAETFDISKTLSRYFQIDRGKITNDATILGNYKAIIIADPQNAFTEAEKFVIDQYIMNGGSVLWLVEGVKLNRQELSVTGISPAIAADYNLNDMLFKYGVRINPVLVQDLQCVSVLVNVAPQGQNPQFEPFPWYFSPMLTLHPQHPVTKNITAVKADFASVIDLVGENDALRKNVLLATSANTKLTNVPTTIDVASANESTDKSLFNASYLPVAVLVEGNFQSVFTNRIMPPEIVRSFPFMQKSLYTRQIFIADGDIIRNETTGLASDSTTLPLGFDRYTGLQYGNSDFLKNAILYLTDETGWMQLRAKTIQLRLLNKESVNKNKTILQIINVLLPVLLVFFAGFVYNYFRKRKYTNKIF